MKPPAPPPPAAPATTPEIPAAPAAPVRHDATAPEPIPPAPTKHPRPDASPTELAFDEGFADLRAGDPAAAATAFERAASGTGSLVEDASFWHAVALRRDGRTDSALHAFVSFLERYPGSPRAGEAAVAAGWLELGAGRQEAAAAHFKMGTGDPSPRVRASAQDGLRAATER